jgi:hypothetical protein
LQVCPGVTVRGPGAGRLVISGDHASRVLEVLPGDGVTLSGLTITGGLANAPGSGSPTGRGGGVYVDAGASLTMIDSVVAGNTANANPVAAPGSSTVSGMGGGIYNGGTLTLLDDVVRGNTANAASALQGNSIQVDGMGGGIFNAYSTGTLTVADSAIDGNTANTGSSTVAGYGNTTSGEGGAIKRLRRQACTYH